MKRYENLEKLYGLAEGPFYMLDLDQLKRNYQSFLSSMRRVHPSIEIGYSYKTNYTKEIIRTLSDMGAYSEIVSKLEFDIAMSSKVNINRIIFNGPIKDISTLEKVLLGGGLVHLDSKQELKLIEEIAQQASLLHPLRIGLRFNLSCDKYPSRFGFDINSKETLDVIDLINQNKHLTLEALHIHYPDRSIELFKDRVQRFFDFIVRTFDELPQIINLGSGFFHEMSSEEANRIGLPHETKFNDYADVLSQSISTLTMKFGHKFNLFFEPGTPLVVNCMKLVGQVFSVKKINSKFIATTDISIFDFNPRSYPKKNLVEVVCSYKLTELTEAIIVGNTCVENDIIKNDYLGPISSESFVVVSNVGSYSNVMKPPFISPSLPILVVDDAENFVRMAKKRLTSEQIIYDYE